MRVVGAFSRDGKGEDLESGVLDEWHHETSNQVGHNVGLLITTTASEIEQLTVPLLSIKLCSTREQLPLSDSSAIKRSGHQPGI